MKTKRSRQLLIWLLIGLLALSGCQDREEDGRSESEAISSESQVVSSEQTEKEEQEAAEFTIRTLEPEGGSSQQYHWLILENGRRTVSQEDVQQINDRLKELQTEGSVVFHIVTMTDYVTPEVLDQISRQLEGKIDFVSLSPSLCGFSMKDWENCFIELTDTLTDGEMKEFYSAVPPAVWEANQIADGLYSFSNTTLLTALGYGFYQEVYDKLGEENLNRLQQANGIEEEGIWKELYELQEGAVVVWTGLTWGKPEGSPENPYDRMTLAKLANGWDELYYSYVTDDIRYNVESGAFEWLGESETYGKLRETVRDYYEKGYIREKDARRERSEGLDAGAGSIQYGYINEPGRIEEEDAGICYWVPAAEKAKITTRWAGESGMYSFVYRSAQDGWESMLNLLGADPAISDILNRFYTMTITGILQQSDRNLVSREGMDRYTIIETAYETAETDPLQGFVFNPVPIQEQWEAYNRAAFSLSAMQMIHTETDPQTGELTVYEADMDAMENLWSQYRQIMKEAGIDQILDEVSRQYKEWKS